MVSHELAAPELFNELFKLLCFFKANKCDDECVCQLNQQAMYGSL